jgi:hypothetical protein
MDITILFPDNTKITTDTIHVDKITPLIEYFKENPLKSIINMEEILLLYDNNWENKILKRINFYVATNNSTIEKETKKTMSEISKVCKLIIKYALLYPMGVSESDPPSTESVFRNITSLLSIEEGVLIEKILSYKNLKKQVHILTLIMSIANVLKMDILSSKIGAVLAIKLRDKSLLTIHKALLYT